ncbi:MAG: diguanylate cyclase [Armatimonadetes bacterium]|nr:diguanylate cyclase [Armatimonadota bacterium]NIM23557.1 diguanylate cyclase [Armatimonadota bacterium]NIM67423.1 diguanylate cyclase [Armatimonadota bacterium]NIM75924.1 diguanylate cyclase [Armatimonadota bacterium]NIN05609.1 diguanylate cyclase [Armatimonadota bacterium]
MYKDDRLISDTTAIFLRAIIFAAAIIATVTSPLRVAEGRTVFFLLGGGIVWVLLSSLSLLSSSRNPLDTRSHMALVCLDVAMVSVIVWAMGPQSCVYAMFYYVPILYAITRLDIRSCIASSALAAVAYFFISLVANTLRQNLLEVITFSFSALVLATMLGILYAELHSRKTLAESLRTSLQRLSAIYDVARTAWSESSSLEDVLKRVLQEIGDLAKTHECYIALLDKEGELAITAHEQAEGEFYWEAALESIRERGRSHPLRESTMGGGGGTGTTLTLPLLTSRDVLGAVQIQRKGGFWKRELETIQALCAEVAVAIENACLRRELVRLATTDPVTGLYNRTELSNRMSEERARALRQGHSLSLLMIDVDGFKRINDRAGHAAGDSVLYRLAEVLRGQLRECDSAGRWGGDEFCLLLPETSFEESLAAAEKLRRDFRECANKHLHAPKKREIEDLLSSATVSIGIISNSDGSLSAEQLLSFADRALYAAKSAGRDMVKAFLVGADSKESPPPPDEDAAYDHFTDEREKVGSTGPENGHCSLT